MKKIINIILVLTLLITTTACSEKYSDLSSTFSGPFNTVIEFRAYVKDQREFDNYVSMIKENFTKLDQLFDRYKSYEGINNIKTINDNAGISIVEVDPIIIDLIDTWINEYNSISTKVNIALGPVLDLWHEARMNASLNENDIPIGQAPDQEVLEEASQYCNEKDIVIDQENNTVYLLNEHSSIDVGAIAKGYAVEYVKNLLIESGAESFTLAAGDNYVCYGDKLISDSKTNINKLERSKREYTVGIPAPQGGAYANLKDCAAYIVSDDKNTNGTAVVTSGDYDQFFMDEEGNAYNHLIDGNTLYPANYMRSVTVITNNSTYADFLSTALFLMDVESGIHFVEDLDGVEAIWLLNDGSIKVSSGLIFEDNYYSVLQM